MYGKIFILVKWEGGMIFTYEQKTHVLLDFSFVSAKDPDNNKFTELEIFRNPHFLFFKIKYAVTKYPDQFKNPDYLPETVQTRFFILSDEYIYDIGHLVEVKIKKYWFFRKKITYHNISFSFMNGAIIPTLKQFIQMNGSIYEISPILLAKMIQIST